MSYNPVKNVDFNSLPNYAIANVPILTYALLGITTLTLGYITIKDKEDEKGDTSSLMQSALAPTTAIASAVPSPSVPSPSVEKGGRKPKSKKSKTRSKKH